VFKLRFKTVETWVECVNSDIDTFLVDHAHNERKAASAALTLAAHHPNHSSLVDRMITLAQEELVHFREVYDLLCERNIELGFDCPDPYMGRLHKLLRKDDTLHYLLDRLLIFGIVEARGCERFQILAQSLKEESLRPFYARLAREEAKHLGSFTSLARHEFGQEMVQARLDDLLKHEAEIIQELPVRIAVH
jgi:tRNA 2-(methylsulfanyl)-N6-isopentenyladenosine37 hydroxylase